MGANAHPRRVRWRAPVPCAPPVVAHRRGACAQPVPRGRAHRPCPVAVGKMRTTCFEPYQAYWLELFFDNRKCNKIRLANRLTTRSRFGDAAHGQPVHKSLREKKKAIPPKFAILKPHSSTRRCKTQQQNKRGIAMEHNTTIGIDVSDKTSKICMIVTSHRKCDYPSRIYLFRKR